MLNKMLKSALSLFVNIFKGNKGKTSLVFEPYGYTLYCGQQGAGKTISMVEYVNRMRARYPDLIHESEE